MTFPESPVGLAIMIMQFSIRASIIKGKLKKPKGTVDISKVIYQSNFFNRTVTKVTHILLAEDNFEIGTYIKLGEVT